MSFAFLERAHCIPSEGKDNHSDERGAAVDKLAAELKAARCLRAGTAIGWPAKGDALADVLALVRQP